MKQHLETSKKLTYIITLFFLFIIMVAIIVQIKFNADISHLLNYLAPIQGTIIVAYFGKSGVENFTKIKSVTGEAKNYNEGDV